MCGIAGIFNFPGTDANSLEHSIRQMLAITRHRGPDETGVYLSDRFAMGSVRLSIIDLSTGQQPICDQSGNFWIVFNGEIFNYVELRDELISKGIVLHTHSDTEVVVQMYALYGPACLSRFNGQFAISIWDKQKRELFIARDRVGIRPVFYWRRDGGFAYCSEIKGLFTLPNVERAIRPKSLAQAFTLWTTLTPNTPFEGVLELPPAHYMKVNEKGVRIERYWSLGFPNESNIVARNLSDTVEEFRELFSDAVRIRLRADVPVGAYLSGGLDSSVTTAFIHELEPGILNTYSIGFKDSEFDETPYQQEASRYFNTNHTSYLCSSEEIAENFPQTVWHAEFPLLRTSPTPMYLLSKKVHESNIKVVVTGEGADEFMGGYNIFKEAMIRRFWAREPQSKLRPLLLQRLYPYLQSMKGMNSQALKLFFGYRLADTNDPLYSHLLRWHNTSRITSFFSGDLKSSVQDYNPVQDVYQMLPEGFEEWSGLSKSQFLEISIFMSSYLLSSQGDRMAMGNSVEGRYPFLDYRVMEFCNALPDKLKINGLDEKYLLKKMIAGKIPDSILNRPKQAYRAPIARSFFGAGSPDYVAEILSEASIHATGLFDPGRVEQLVGKMREGKNISEVDQMAIAGILSTQLLHEQFIKKPVIPDSDEILNCRVVREN
ncbi:MAG: asparagine synthase (glutamine-hydrolyzing) [Bacteroidetes bacterium]|nr:asparagine synthase (glutamine-hydrolyzing) [Bacteroidota bacterium]